VLTDLREGWFLYFQSFKPLSTIHLDVFCKSQRLSRIKNPKWRTPFRPGVARLSDPTARKDQVFFTQPNFSENKKEEQCNTASSTEPPGHLAKHPLPPNIGMDIEPRTRIIHHSYHSVNSNIRPDLNPPCHNHYIDIYPCKEQCASLEKFLHELWSHTWCTESSLWKLNVCLLRDNFCLNFKTQPLQIYFPMWWTLVCLLRGGLTWTL
jgi:hypothetical protein